MTTSDFYILGSGFMMESASPKDAPNPGPPLYVDVVEDLLSAAPD